MPYPEEAPSAFATESITVATTAVGCTVATFRPSDAPEARRAVLTLEIAQIRWWPTGDPTATVGHIANVGDSIILTGAADIANFRAIRTGATSGVLQASYER